MFACEFRDRVQMKSSMKVENQAGDEAKGNDEITGHEAEITLAEHNENRFVTGLVCSSRASRLLNLFLGLGNLTALRYW